LFFERPQASHSTPESDNPGEQAVLVHLEFPASDNLQPSDPEEFTELVLSAGGDPAALIQGQRNSPDPRYFVGSGKLEEIHEAVKTADASLVIFDHALSPTQERNLEKYLCCRVLDRTGLILDIFAQRARTHEGKLQVELAQLRHMSTRLVRGWTHLERQKGGIGLRGPGETQLETDRRLLRARIKTIEKRLEKVRKQREQGRRSRRRNQLPTIALVGYTNAGKSTLFNSLTEAEVYAEDQLFATLDPTMRRIDLAASGTVILADTVGFISHLPHQLVQAFRATLEEVANADLLLHVVDASSEERDQHIHEVCKVLEELDAEELPQLQVMNKIDLLEDKAPGVDEDADGTPKRVWLSAQQQTGFEELFNSIDKILGDDIVDCHLTLEPRYFNLRTRLYQQGQILNEQSDELGRSTLHLKISRRDLYSALNRLQIPVNDIALKEKTLNTVQSEQGLC